MNLVMQARMGCAGTDCPETWSKEGLGHHSAASPTEVGRRKGGLQEGYDLHSHHFISTE